MPSRAAQVTDVPGVEDALATGDPRRCARAIAEILRSGADRREVARTAGLAAARHFDVGLPPPHALLALSAALDLAPASEPPELPIVQACALAASEWRPGTLSATAQTVSGDELHLGLSFRSAVRAMDSHEADGIFSGLLREGEERRLAGDVLFEVCEADVAGQGHKLTLAVGAWRLARALGWSRGPVLLRPVVHLAAGATQDLAEFAAVLREVGRARMDFDLAARNVAPIDAVAQNTFDIALRVGPDRLVADVIHGLKRGRSGAGYADLLAATASQQLIGNPAALEPALFCLAARFVLGFSRTPTHLQALLLAARIVAQVVEGSVPAPARIADADGGLRDLAEAIRGGDGRGAAGLALGLVDADHAEALAGRLVREAVREDAHADGGHRLLYASWAAEFARIVPGPALASLAALLARTPTSRSVAGVL